MSARITATSSVDLRPAGSALLVAMLVILAGARRGRWGSALGAVMPRSTGASDTPTEDPA